MFLVDEKMGAAAAVYDELLLVVFRRLDGGDAPPLRRRLYSLLRRINFRPNTDSAWRMSSDVHMTFSVSEGKKKVSFQNYSTFFAFSLLVKLTTRCTGPIWRAVRGSSGRWVEAT